MKVCLVNRNTVFRDKRALQEATILTHAGLELVIIGLLDARHDPFEIRDGFYIKKEKIIEAVRYFEPNSKQRDALVMVRHPVGLHK